MSFLDTLNKLRSTARVLFVLALLVPAMACDSGPPITATGHSVISLTDLFKRAEKTNTSSKLSLDVVLNQGMETLAGAQRPVIRQHPAGTLRYRLRIPRNAVLRFGYCMAPYIWNRSPDGVRFHLRARRIDSGGGAPARPLVLFSAALDPKNQRSHRRVFEQLVDLEELGGGVWELVFTLSHGAGKNVEWDEGFWVDPRIEYPAGTVDIPPGDPSRPDILLVTVDSLRADVLPSFGERGAPGPAAAAAPVISRLAAEGMRAAAAFTPSTLTIPSYASILTGAAPADHGLHRENQRTAPAVPTAGERFAAQGYRTAAFLGTSRLSAGRSGLSRGFELYDCPAAGQRSAEETVLSVLDWIRNGDGRPSFCWIQFNELRPPLAQLRGRDRHYYPRGGYNRWDESIIRLLPHFERRLDLKQRWYRWLHDVTTTGYVEASYLGQVDEVDRQLGRVIEELRSRSQLEKTAVAVTSNRGLALGENGVFYTGETLQPGVTRVPLIIRLPGRIPAAVRLPEQAPCTTADILPTLLGLLSPAETGGTMPSPAGIDLRKALGNTTPLERRLILLEGHVGRAGRPNRYALVAGGYKLTESPGSTGVTPVPGDPHAWSSDSHYHNDDLFHILSDPGELSNLDGSRLLADIQKQMHRHLMPLAQASPAASNRVSK